MKQATPEQIVAFLTGKKMTDIVPITEEALATLVAEVERLQFKIEHLQDELEDERAEVERLKAERLITKQMLEDILDRSQHYGLGRGGLDRS